MKYITLLRHLDHLEDIPGTRREEFGDNMKLRLGYIVLYTDRIKEGFAGQANIRHI